MRALLLAACLAPLLSAQIVEESFARDPGPLDFIRGEGLEQAILQHLAGDALLGLSPAGVPVPRLADRWEARPGLLRLHLRGGATFSDGAPVRVEDVLWTFRELRRDASASPTRRALLEGLDIAGSEGWIEVRSQKPSERLMTDLAQIPIAEAGRAGVGSGPFSLRRSGAEWRFTARPHFLAPRIQGLHFRIVADEQAALQNLQKGWLSIGVPPARQGLRPPPTHVEVSQATHAQVVVWSRPGPAPLKSLEAWRGEAFPPGLFGAKARASRGLWPESLGFGPRPMAGGVALRSGRLECLYAAGDDLVQRALLALRARAARDGVGLDPRPVESALLYARLQKGDFQLACAMVVFDPHPWSVLEYLEPGAPMNFTGWTHPGLQALLPRLNAGRGPAWDSLQALWAQAPAALPLLDLTSVVWVDRRLKVAPGPLGLYFSTPGAAGWSWAP